MSFLLKAVAKMGLLKAGRFESCLGCIDRCVIVANRTGSTGCGKSAGWRRNDDSAAKQAAEKLGTG
jgi:hypothetical protein